MKTITRISRKPKAEPARVIPPSFKRKATARDVLSEKDTGALTTCAKEFVQASMIRLSMEKIECTAKKGILTILKANKLSSFSVSAKVDGRKYVIPMELATSQSSVLNMEKLAKYLTPEQIMECSTVTLTKAKEVLPQALIDRCTEIKTGNTLVKITKPDGFPVPEITLY